MITMSGESRKKVRVIVVECCSNDVDDDNGKVFVHAPQKSDCLVVNLLYVGGLLLLVNMCLCKRFPVT